MRVGDLVRFKRGRWGPGDGTLFLIMQSIPTWDHKGRGSPFSKWEICNTSTGKVYTQNTRDLEVISELY
jgi:hypothetical protein